MTDLERLELILRDLNLDNPQLSAVKTVIHTLIVELTYANVQGLPYEQERLKQLRREQNER